MTPPAAPTPPPDECLLYDLPSILDPLDWARIFPRPQPLEVELGCGDGSFLLDQAARFPDCNFVGIERLLGRIRKIDRKGRRRGLKNLRGIRIEAGYFLKYLVPRQSVEAIHAYFPDPWPKAKHERHRLINRAFPALAEQALLPRGQVHLRTDDAPYFEQMQEVFAAHPQFAASPTPSELASRTTDFEREFLAQGRPILRATYTLAAAPLAGFSPLRPDLREDSGAVPDSASGSPGRSIAPSPTGG